MTWFSKREAKVYCGDSVNDVGHDKPKIQTGNVVVHTTAPHCTQILNEDKSTHGGPTKQKGITMNYGGLNVI